VEKKTKKTAATETIPRPTGNVNDNYSLVVEMGLKDEKSKFRAMQVRARFVFEVNNVNSFL
jgi:hypothetical protein